MKSGMRGGGAASYFLIKSVYPNGKFFYTVEPLRKVPYCELPKQRRLIDTDKTSRTRAKKLAGEVARKFQCEEPALNNLVLGAVTRIEIRLCKCIRHNRYCLYLVSLIAQRYIEGGWGGRVAPVIATPD